MVTNFVQLGMFLFLRMGIVAFFFFIFSKSFKQHDWLLRLLLALAVSRPLRVQEESLLDKQAPREALPSSSHSMSLVFTLSGASQCSSKHNIFKFSAFPAALLPAQPVTSIHSPGGGLLDEIRQARCSVQCLHRTLSCFDRGAELETEDLTLLKVSLPL